MTQPIQEPLTQRAISGLTWDKNQLYRRPDPGGGMTSIPWARRSMGSAAGGQSIPQSAFEEFEFDEEYNMGTGESGEPWFQPETSGGTPYGIELLQDAFLLIQAGAWWDDVVNATWFIWADEGPGFWINYPQFAGQSVTTTAGTFTYFRRCLTGEIVRAGVFQTTGAPKNLDFAYLEVAVLGAWTGTAPNDMDPPT